MSVASSAGKDSPKPRRRIRAWHLLLLTLAIVLGGHLLWLWMLNRSVNAKIEAIREAGYPVTAQEVDDQYETVPRAENAAVVLGRAFTRIQEPTQKSLKKSLPLMGEADLPEPAEALPEQMSAAIEKVLADNERALKRLHEGAARKRARYPVDLSQGIDTLLPHLSKLRSGANLLALQGLHRIAADEPEKAAESVGAVLGLARSLRAEPVLVSLLVRRNLQRIALQLLRRAVTRGELPAGTVRELQHRLAAAETPGAMPRTVAAERGLMGDVFRQSVDQIVQTYGITRGAFRSFWGKDPVTLTAHRYTGLLMLDRLTYLSVLGEWIRAAERPLPGRHAAMKRLEKKTRDLPFYATVTKALSPSLEQAVEVDGLAIARLRAARLGLAIERYRLASDDLPEALEALTPKFIKAVPADPFTGDPLKYEQLKTGYTVYSVNKDGTDDGGKAAPEDEPLKAGTDLPFRIAR